MKDKILLQSIRLYYYRYREFIVPICIIVVCCILIVFIVIPQLQTVLAKRNQYTDEQDTLQVLQHNFDQITSMNDDLLDKQYHIVSLAVPQEKDVTTILNTISATASKANVSLDDYSFQVGKLAFEGNESHTQLNLSVTGDISAVQKFTHALKTSLPLSNVTSIVRQNSNTTSVTVVFYAKRFTKSSFDATMPLQLLSKQDQQTLDTITAWQQ